MRGTRALRDRWHLELCAALEASSLLARVLLRDVELATAALALEVDHRRRTAPRVAI
ncbi:MAG: hypothetical protein ACYC6T_08235 [Thermoleophilia bacterium]